MNKTFYITTAIDYPSAPPHIGHVYEKVCADVIARWHRKTGYDVFFSAGTDEHGQKIQRYSLKSNENPQEFVDKMSKKFIDLWEKLNISYDGFIRTTQSRHIEIVKTIFKKIYEKGDIYKDIYEGLYCVDCEAFYTEKDLKEGFCPVHSKKAEKVKEEGFFFRMSKYQEKILEHILFNENFIQPQTRRNEIINRIKEGVKDLCISRSSFNWGIPMPLMEKHIIFVWFDALINYISVLGYPNEKFKKYWPANIHLIGKDISWFHAVVWPAMLLAADIELPKKIFVHGFVNIKGEKISKSKGIVVDPSELVNKYGADALRYFLLREIPFGEDGDFSEDALILRVNSDLANDIGNLLNRSLTMIEKYFQGALPKPGPASKIDEELKLKALGLAGEIDKAMEDLNFSSYLESVISVVNCANKYIETKAPWVLYKENKIDEIATMLYYLAEVLRIVTIAVYPVMPLAATNMWKQLGFNTSISQVKFDDMKKWGLIEPETKINKGAPLFPRIDKKGAK